MPPRIAVLSKFWSVSPTQVRMIPLHSSVLGTNLSTWGDHLGEGLDKNHGNRGQQGSLFPGLSIGFLPISTWIMTWLRSRSPVSWAIGVNHWHQVGPCLSRTGDSPATKLPSFSGKPWTSSRFLRLWKYIAISSIIQDQSSRGSNHWILHFPQLSHVAHELFSKTHRDDPHDLMISEQLDSRPLQDRLVFGTAETSTVHWRYVFFWSR